MPRMGLFTIAMGRLSSKEHPVSFLQKMAIGSICGGVAACIGVPTEVALVRMSADAKAPVGERRGYASVLDAVARVAREEGPSALWRGAVPTVARAMLLNAGQLATYSEGKARLEALSGQRGLHTQFAAAVCSASAAVALSSPADVVKSRVQNSLPGEYSGMMDCALKLIRLEGATAFWKGAGPAVAKLAPHSVVSFIVLDNLTKFITGRDAM